jgi:hypothetical protein
VVISGEAQRLLQCHWNKVGFQEQARCKWDCCEEQGKIGWDAMPEPDIPFQQPHDDVQADNMQGEEEQAVQESMVLNPSNASSSSVNMENEGLELLALANVQNQPADQLVQNVLQVGAVLIGPSLPPEMIWRNVFEQLMPGLMSKEVPLSVKMPAFLMAKRSWNIAFDLPDRFAIERNVLSQCANRVAVNIKRRPVARTLVFEPLENTEVSADHVAIFSASPVTVRKKRGRKQKPLIVQPEERRFTRSSLKLNGYRPTPVMTEAPRLKKKQRAKLLLVDMPVDTAGTVDKADDIASSEDAETNNAEDVEIPPTPIHVMQNVGIDLGIDPKKLTKDMLEADPNDLSPTDQDD